MAGLARFQKGSFAETGLADGVADAAVSLDAIMYAPDKRAAFAEAARVLRPGGRFVYTAFELNPEGVAGQPVIGADPTDDFRPSMEAAGLSVLTYEETPGWKERLYGAYTAVRDSQEALRAEMGPIAIAAFMSEVTAVLERHMYKRRVYCLAQRA
jgi:ubiquinone/menaquinone biosynthesis C-methylase UbiE